jgi:hypothetical protein
MTQNIETLPFFERFQHPVSRRAMLLTLCAATGAAVLAMVPSSLKGVQPKNVQAPPVEASKQNAKLAARRQALAMRHPGPRW